METMQQIDLRKIPAVYMNLPQDTDKERKDGSTSYEVWI